MIRPPRPALALAAAALLCAALALPAAGCSVLAEDYPAASAEAVAAFERGSFARAATRFGARQGALGSDEFLALAEAGMAWHVAGDLERATRAWLQALDVLEGFRDRPTVSGRTLTESALSLVLNDKTLPYDGETFEACLLHAFLAWDYLRLGSLDDAMVEVLRGYALQEREEERFQAAYGMNRFARFLAALAQELDGRPDEAEMDLRTLEREVPGNASVAYSLERARRLQGAAAADEWAQCQLVVVYEQGRMAAKEPQEVVYPGKRSLGRISVPGFGRPHTDADGVRLWLDGREAGRTELLENVVLVARDNLEDRVGWTLAKAAGRSIAKTVAIESLAEEIAEEHGEGAGAAFGLVAGLLSMATERADLRSWLTLPAAIQVLRLPVPAGEHDIALELAGTRAPGPDSRAALGRYRFRPGQPVFVAARSLRGRLFASAAGAQPSPAVPVPAP